MLSVCPTATSECGPKPRKVPLARSPESSASGSPPTAGGPGPAAPWDSPHQFGPLRTASSWPVLPPSNELPRLSDAPPPEVAGLVCADWSFQPFPARDSLIGRALWLPTIQPPPIRPPEHIPGHIEPARATGAPVPGFEPGRAPLRTRVLAFIAGRFGRIGRRPVLVVVAAVLAFFVAPPLISRFQAGAVSTPKAAESPVEHSLPAHPARKAAATKPRQSDPPEDRWAAFEQILAKRAGYSWNEDFRSGFDNWESPSGNLPSTWRLDETGFVMPSELGVFLPSQQMADYTMEFFGEADRRALAWAFRVRDFRNYYAAKLVISRPGPLPVISLRRYAVINGRESATRETVLPLTVRGKPALQVRMEVKGSDFSVHVQDRLVGYWSDPRIVSGGVGFFSSRGEISRIRWLHVAHQYDVLGRICAYLSPSVKASNGNRPMGVGKHGQP